MTQASNSTADLSVGQELLDQLQRTLHLEIPMCAQMGIQVDGYDDHGLWVSMPLNVNRNHQQTAFAGSLNALCTVAGWGYVYLINQTQSLPGSIVIRRSTIKYQRPVLDTRIAACCLAAPAAAVAYYAEMLTEKLQAKLDLAIEIPAPDGPAVVFHGSYVVLGDVDVSQ